MDDGARLAAAARRLLGCPFRLHGRDPATGFDCVGVVAAAMDHIGHAVAVPADYRLRGGSLPRFDQWASAWGLKAVSEGSASALGDILLCEVAVQHFHVMLDCGDVLVHAHVSLGRVVACPPPAPWPVRRRWRLQQG